jgi:hypothetical protein
VLPEDATLPRVPVSPGFAEQPAPNRSRPENKSLVARVVFTRLVLRDGDE